DRAVSARTRSGVVLRTLGALRGPARRRLSDRCRRHALTAAMIDPYLLVRAASLYLSIVTTGVAWIWRRPLPGVAAAALLGFFWNLPALLVVNVVAIRMGWWQYDARGGLLLGIPVDLFLSWAWLW